MPSQKAPRSSSTKLILAGCPRPKEKTPLTKEIWFGDVSHLEMTLCYASGPSHKCHTQASNCFHEGPHKVGKTLGPRWRVKAIAEPPRSRCNLLVEFSRMSFAAVIMRSIVLWHPKRWNHLSCAIGLAILISSSASETAAEQTNDASTRRVSLHIPAQPLAQALIAYGAATGFELYYNAALAEGRRSNAVNQTLLPVDALRKLLEGTGLRAQITSPASFILMQAPREIIRQAAPATRRPGPYESYFADLQARVGAALCNRAATSQQGEETFLRVWLSSSGLITRADIFGANEDGANQRDFVNAVQGLSVMPPPSNMPQPITLVVFPSTSVWRNCDSTDWDQGAK
jgi:hypothetical protein